MGIYDYNYIVIDHSTYYGILYLLDSHILAFAWSDIHVSMCFTYLVFRYCLEVTKVNTNNQQTIEVDTVLV